MVGAINKKSVLKTIFSLILFLVSLEIFLSLGGNISLPDYGGKSKSPLDLKDEYRILCIGDSTTLSKKDTSYPEQLQKVLDERNTGRIFKVINGGVAKFGTEHTLLNIDKNLERYKPHLVITMLGINDKYNVGDYKKGLIDTIEYFLDNLRIYKLAMILKSKIQYKINMLIDWNGYKEILELGFEKNERLEFEDFAAEKNPDSLDKIADVKRILNKLEIELIAQGESHQEIKNKQYLKKIDLHKSYSLIRKGRRFMENGMLSKAQEIFQKSCALTPDNFLSFLELGRNYKKQTKFKEAFSMFKKAIEINPDVPTGALELARMFDILGKPEKTTSIFKELLKSNKLGYWLYLELGDWFDKQNMFKEAETAYLKCSGTSLKYSKAYEKLAALYLKHNRIIKAERMFNTLKEKNREDFAMIEGLALFYDNQGKQELALEYSKKAQDKSINMLHPKTVQNYNAISRKILERNIKLISMQYPLRNIESLTKKLHFTKNIVFVENKTNFEKLFESGHYYLDYFFDNFAGNFGHCTTKGNRLIASQLADVILNDILNE